jgi:hypothetical protein
VIALIESSRIHASCCHRIRFGRFCSDCGKPLVAREKRKVRIVMENNGKEYPFDSIKDAADWTGLSRRQIETSLDGRRRKDGTRFVRLAAAGKKE